MADEATNAGVVAQGAVVNQWTLQAPQGATPTSFGWTPTAVSASAEVKREEPSEGAVAAQDIVQAPQGATPTTFNY